MGLDVGNKTIGVALSDVMGLTAQGLEVIKRKSLSGDLKRLGEIIKEYDVGKVVVGLPKNMNGSIGPQAETVLEFIQHLKKSFNIPIEQWDERLTTLAAERVLIDANVSRQKRRKVVDKMAAVFILQGYLDRGI